MENILLFAFMAFWIYGWVLLWPISKVKKVGLRSWLTILFFAVLVLSAIFDLATGPNFENLSHTLETMFGLSSLLFWIPLLLGLLASYIMSKDTDKDAKLNAEQSVGDEVFGAFAVTVFVTLFCMAVGYIGLTIFNDFIVPLFTRLFLFS